MQLASQSACSLSHRPPCAGPEEDNRGGLRVDAVHSHGEDGGGGGSRSGSSTGRHAMLDIFKGTDNQKCLPTDEARWASYKKVAVVREPTDRFYAGYDEWFARRLSSQHTVPAAAQAAMEVRRRAARDPIHRQSWWWVGG